jgi:hypothetical protein
MPRHWRRSGVRAAARAATPAAATALHALLLATAAVLSSAFMCNYNARTANVGDQRRHCFWKSGSLSGSEFAVFVCSVLLRRLPAAAHSNLPITLIPPHGSSPDFCGAVGTVPTSFNISLKDDTKCPQGLPGRFCVQNPSRVAGPHAPASPTTQLVTPAALQPPNTRDQRVPQPHGPDQLHLLRRVDHPPHHRHHPLHEAGLLLGSLLPQCKRDERQHHMGLPTRVSSLQLEASGILPSVEWILWTRWAGLVGWSHGL